MLFLDLHGVFTWHCFWSRMVSTVLLLWLLDVQRCGFTTNFFRLQVLWRVLEDIINCLLGLLLLNLLFFNEIDHFWFLLLWFFESNFFQRWILIIKIHFELTQLVQIFSTSEGLIFMTNTRFSWILIYGSNHWLCISSASHAELKGFVKSIIWRRPTSVPIENDVIVLLVTRLVLFLVH